MSPTMGPPSVSCTFSQPHDAHVVMSSNVVCVSPDWPVDHQRKASGMCVLQSCDDSSRSEVASDGPDAYQKRNGVRHEESPPNRHHPDRQQHRLTRHEPRKSSSRWSTRPQRPGRRDTQ